MTKHSKHTYRYIYDLNQVNIMKISMILRHYIDFKTLYFVINNHVSVINTIQFIHMLYDSFHSDQHFLPTMHYLRMKVWCPHTFTH